MKSDTTLIDHYRKTLEIALKYDAVPIMLETLVRLAEVFKDTGEKRRALEIVALSLCYPLQPKLKSRAEILLYHLEKEFERLIVESTRAKTDELTLDEMVEAILAV